MSGKQKLCSNYLSITLKKLCVVSMIGILLYMCYIFENTSSDEIQKKLPGVIIIGVQKCGTGALKEFMMIHPNLKGLEYECHFFDQVRNRTRGGPPIDHAKPFEEEMKRYLERFPVSFENETVFEKTPAYFDRADPYDIYRMNPALKLILLVCDPVRRVISEYLMDKFQFGKHRNKTFEDYIFDVTGNIRENLQEIQRSKYNAPLQRYLKVFPRKQILILDSVYLMRQPTKAMQDVETYLGINKFYTDNTFYFNEDIGYYCINPLIQPLYAGCMNKGKYRTHPNISTKNLMKLKQYFHPFNERFMKIAGVKISSLMYF
ncbi:unnamed protein product [Owenia fusiformis]|uniref:Uncharacterized protein n=1 Tax=Owenia fusiformis TaxID=6347 RepID=A0A8J1XWZ8_OWEFU|nr:unnamed protein product [Owenia fusiformis]